MKQIERSRGGRPWSFDRDKALDTAMRLFWRHGYEGVSIGDLTDALGIAPPSLYGAFGSKAELYREAVAQYEKRFGLIDPAAVQQAGSLTEAVRLLLENAVRAVTDPSRERGCMISSGMIACHPDHADLAKHAANRREALRKQIAKALAPYGKLSDMARLSRYLSAVMQGISIQARDGVPASELQKIVEDVVAGVAARPFGSRSARSAKV
jgi:AcrR family transcriptional regulator